MVIEALPEVKTLSFLPAPVFGLERLSLYYSRCGYEICEYSVGVKLMWHHAYWYAFAEAAGCLLCRAEADGGVYFDFPVPGEHGDVGAALDELESYCKEQELPLRFSTIRRSMKHLRRSNAPDAISFLTHLRHYNNLRPTTVGN